MTTMRHAVVTPLAAGAVLSSAKRAGEFMRNIVVSLAAFVLTALCAAGATPSQPDCHAPEHHQFDFWIGRWNVTDTQTGKPAGSSLIESLYKGCVLRENWRDPQLSGGSLNIYDTQDRKWHQMWTDSVGADRLFTGGLVNGRMVLETTFTSARFPGKTVRYRMTFTHNPDGSVRQYADLSTDGGANWTTNYDYTYRRAQ